MSQKKYRSLSDVYLEKAFALPLPPLPRQTIKQLFEAVADAPPPSPDSAYVQLYIKDPSKSEQQFIGNIDIDYFNDVLKPVINRGSQGSIDVNRLIKKRLEDANITDENLNFIFDFIQLTNMKITPENFSKCGMLIKDNIVRETKFNLGDVLSVSFAQENTPEAREKLTQAIQSNSSQFETLMQLKALKAASGFGARSGLAGPGEVILCFFGNGRKLLHGSKRDDMAGKGDIAIGELSIEVKGTGGRIWPLNKLSYLDGTPRDAFKKLITAEPLKAVKYLVFGSEGEKIKDFDNEIQSLLAAKVAPNTIAIGLALRQYQRLSGFHYYCFVDKKTSNAVGMSVAEKTLPEIGEWYIKNIDGTLKFSGDGHQIPMSASF